MLFIFVFWMIFIVIGLYIYILPKQVNFIRVPKSRSCLYFCGILEENDPYELICLNTFSGGGTVWKGLEKVTLLEDVCTWALRFQKGQHHSQLSLSLPLVLWFKMCALRNYPSMPSLTA